MTSKDRCNASFSRCSAIRANGDFRTRVFSTSMSLAPTICGLAIRSNRCSRSISRTRSERSAWVASRRYGRFNVLDASRLVKGATIAGTVSPDAIPDRPQSEDPEMMNDLIELLRKQSTPNLHLVDLFYSILDKEGAGVQSRRFGMSTGGHGTPHDRQDH